MINLFYFSVESRLEEELSELNRILRSAGLGRRGPGSSTESEGSSASIEGVKAPRNSREKRNSDDSL
jgi:hypothetical protein